MGKRRGTRYSPKPHTSDHPLPIAAATPLANLSLNFVLLHDWWLGRAQPGCLAIGGFECRGRQGQRVLCSAAIAKRHDATTLETVDGITIAISGFINSSRTLQNGFPLEVCSHFLFGFPYDWEDYASQYSNEESASRGSQASITRVPGVNRSSRSNTSSFLPASLDNLPATKIRDLEMFSAGDSQNSILKRTIFDHVLEKLSTHASQNAKISVDSNMGNKHPDICSCSADGENSNCHKKVKANQNCMDDISDSRSTRTADSQKNGRSKMDVSILTPTAGVTTRSMTRLKYLTEKQEEFSSKSSVKRMKAVRLSSPDAKESHYGENQGNQQAKNLSAKSFIIPESNPQLSRSEPSTKNPRKIATRSALRESHATTLSRQKGNIGQLSSPEAMENQPGENLENKQAENLSAKSFITPKSSSQLSTSGPARKIITRTALRESRSTTLARQKGEIRHNQQRRCRDRTVGKLH